MWPLGEDASLPQATKGGALYAFNTTDPSGSMIAWAAFSSNECVRVTSCRDQTARRRARWLRALAEHGATLENEAEVVSHHAVIEDDSCGDEELAQHPEPFDGAASSPEDGPNGPQLGLVYSRMPLSTLFGERAPAQAWEGRPPRRSSQSAGLDGWPSGLGSALPAVAGRKLLNEVSDPESSGYGGRRGECEQTFAIEVGRPADDGQMGILRRSASRGSSARSLPRSDATECGDSEAQSTGASQGGGGTKTVRFEALEKRDDLVPSPSFSSAIDSPGSARSVTTVSSVSTPVSRGQAAGKRVVAQWLNKETHLGSGTFGSVYRGTYFNQRVAIKELIVQDLSTESAAEFEREADLHYHLRHTNVILLLCYNVDPGNGPTCMVMELAQCSLFDVLHKNVPLPGGDRSRPSGGGDDLHLNERDELSIHTRLRILEDVASGLMFLHTLDIMHLDLKSLNLLLDAAGVVKLADFGLSVVKSEIEGSEGKAIGACALASWFPTFLPSSLPPSSRANPVSRDDGTRD